MLTLSKRLRSIAGLITPCDTVADIVCDHGFLSIYLIREKIAQHVIASDINKGPIERATEHIRMYGLDNCIETIQCDGLTGIDRADAIVIAGMGGRLMLKILTDSPGVVSGARELILQPQSEISEFRKGLCAMGLQIVAEDFVIEDGKYYPMMKAVPGHVELSETEAMYGPLLLKEKNRSLQEFLIRQNVYLKGLLEKLPPGGSEKSSMRRVEITGELRLNEEALRHFTD